MIRRLASAILCAAIISAFAVSAPGARADDAASLSDAQKSEIEKLIHDYIVKNPQVILDAVRAHQEAQAAAEEQAQQQRLVDMREQIENGKLSPVGGNAAGNVTVVEFFDYRCGYCKRVHDIVVDTVADDGNVRFVYKEFPILGPESVIAARAALGVFYNQKDKYIDFHNALMTAKGAFSEARVLDIAASVDLDKDAVKKHMDDPRIDTELRHNMALAEALGIRGTPAFIVNNTLVPGALDRETLENLIKEARGS
ncbi:MAG: thioredoxin domain-containing protein [Rhodospirillales bacterium]|nr:thioredoxin domain-containing protein [Rhodospirillales bacterium]MBO6785829.1 thioredoxin domain-containing protein [Rhodospirillales bacterium]